MNQKKSLKKNIVYNVLYQIIIVIIPFIISPFLSRTLGAEKTGVYSYTYSIAYYFMMFGRLGMITYGNRQIARIRDNKEEMKKEFWSMASLQLILSTLSILIYVVYVYFFAKEDINIFYIQLLAILGNMLDVTWLFYGMEEFRVPLLRNLLVKIVSCVLIFVFVKDSTCLPVYTLIMALSALIGQVLVWPYIFRNIGFVKVNFKSVTKHIVPNLILFIPSIAISIFQVMDKIMLGSISSMEEVGYYEYAEKIIAIPKAIITALGTAMLPRMSKLFADGENEKSRIYIRNTMFYVSITSSACAFGLASVSTVFSIVYWGIDYECCGLLIIILCPSIVFSVIGNVIRTQFLIPKSMDKQYVISLIVGAAVNLVGNIFFIRLYGAIGACISTSLSEFIMTLIQLLCVRKKLPLFQYFKDGWIMFVFGIIMFLCVFFTSKVLDYTIFYLIGLVLIGAIVYITLILIYVLLSKNDIIMCLRNKYRERKRMKNESKS